MRRKPLGEEMVRVIRDTHDGRRDYFVTVTEAKRRYNEGKLVWDLTNHCYAEKQQ